MYLVVINDIMVLECIKSEGIWMVNGGFYSRKGDIFGAQHPPPHLLVCMFSCKQSISTLFDYFYIRVGSCGETPFAFDF